MLWKIDTQSSQPLHEQLAGQLRRGIATQELEEGAKLPPARELAKGLGVNVHTVLRAFQTLRDEGLLEIRRGRGTSVAAGAKSVMRHVELARQLVSEARRAGFGESRNSATCGGAVMNEWIRRTALGAGIPVAVAALGLGPYLAYRSDLPDRVASHYGISGRPDGSMTPELFVIVIGALMALGLGGCVAIALSRRKFQPMFAPSVSFVGAFIGALCAGVLATTAIDQRGLDRWQDATLSPWALVLWIGGSVVVGSTAAWIASSLPFKGETGADASPPAMSLAPGGAGVLEFHSVRQMATDFQPGHLAHRSGCHPTRGILGCHDLVGNRDGFGRLQSYTRNRRPDGAAGAIRVLRVASYFGTHTPDCHSSGHRHSPGRLGWLGIPGQPGPHETRGRGPACGSRHPPRPA